MDFEQSFLEKEMLLLASINDNGRAYVYKKSKRRARWFPMDTILVFPSSRRYKVIRYSDFIFLMVAANFVYIWFTGDNISNNWT